MRRFRGFRKCMCPPLIILSTNFGLLFLSTSSIIRICHRSDLYQFRSRIIMIEIVDCTVFWHRWHQFIRSEELHGLPHFAGGLGTSPIYSLSLYAGLLNWDGLKLGLGAWPSGFVSCGVQGLVFQEGAFDTLLVGESVVIDSAI